MARQLEQVDFVELELEQLRHQPVVDVHHLRKAHVVPEFLRLVEPAHGHHRAVERADRAARHGVVAQARFVQRLPHAHLIGAPRAAALEHDGIGFVQIHRKPHPIHLQKSVLSIIPWISPFDSWVCVRYNIFCITRDSRGQDGV